MKIPAEIQTYLKGPSCPAPEGKTSNMGNPPNRNGEAFVFAGLCVFLVTTTTLARAYSRLFLVKQVHIEDYLGFIALVPFAIFVCTYFYFGRHIGFFVQQWDLPGSVLVDSGYISLTTAISYSLLMLLLKSAIILEWVRIFVPHHARNIFYWSSIVLIFMNSGFYVAGIAVTFGSCWPLEKMWHFWVPGTCLESKGRDIASGVNNLALDVFILALPQRIIWTLKMNTRRKIGVAIAFSVGLLYVCFLLAFVIELRRGKAILNLSVHYSVVITATGRVHTIVTMDYPADTTKPFNTSYKFSQASYWGLSEITCIFLEFCVPALPKLFEGQIIFSWVTASCFSLLRSPQRPTSKGSTQAAWPISTGNHADLERELGCHNHARLASELPSTEHAAHGDHRFWPSTDSPKTVTFDSGEMVAAKTSTGSFMESEEPYAIPPNV